ncbi:MAG: alpha/beta fold hydrolase [Chloroflexi bacterium]|nr:alpha/beta fold hydrolase [Chloroflexota bacterium]
MPYLPFRAEFSELAIVDLHRRLDATRWPEVPFASGWAAGTEDVPLRALVRYWRFEFDWFAVQRWLNGFAHLRGPIGEQEELHCVVLSGTGGRGAAPGGAPRVPLLLLHGWPGSLIELLPAAERLAGGVEGVAFDVVVPSLPGFGFSDAPRQPGMHPGRIAERMHALMQGLGYERYGVQGGDWGAHIGARLARAHPEAVLGLHLNFPAGLVPPAGEPDAEERAWQQAMARWWAAKGAYSRLQRTRPHSLGYALTDSPVGLLAWQLEKFWAWSEHGDDLWATLDRQLVLANVTLYWLTKCALPAARTYFEAEHEQPPWVAARCEVPTAFARYPGEPWGVPRAVFERSYRLERWSEPPRGGHFAALEQPELFAADVAAFFAGLR